MRYFLIEARKTKNMTQKELGELVGVSRQAISHLECNRRKGKVDTLQELAKVLEVDIKDLLPSSTISQN